VINFEKSGALNLTEVERRALTEFVEKVCQQVDGELLSLTLFGSRARGDAKPESDMDILVVMSDVDSNTRRKIRYLAAEVWLEYGIYLSTRVWSYSYWREQEEHQTSLYQNILRDGVNLLEPSPVVS